MVHMVYARLIMLAYLYYNILFGGAFRNHCMMGKAEAASLG